MPLPTTRPKPSQNDCDNDDDQTTAATTTMRALCLWRIVLFFLVADRIALLRVRASGEEKQGEDPSSVEREGGEDGEDEGDHGDADGFAGGYTTVTDPDSDDRAADAARYAVDHMSDPDESNRTLDLQVGGGTDVGSLSVVIVRGYSQVVAGTNYRLLLLLAPSNGTAASLATSNGTNSDGAAADSGSCVGSFAVQVYARWDGEKSVAAWGRRVECDEALGLLRDPSRGYGPFHSDFGSSESMQDPTSGRPVTGSAAGASGAVGRLHCLLPTIALASTGLALVS
jgi:hypothetical protein